MSVVCFSGMGAAHEFPHVLKKAKKKKKRRKDVEQPVLEELQRTASVQMRGFSTAKVARLANQIMQLPQLLH